MNASSRNIGFVAIGRNEGERFERCLTSLLKEGGRIVYVDSGSADGSVAYARRLGAEVVCLDLDAPFTASRARNAGFTALRRKWPETDYIMFIDGDCVLTEGFSAAAASSLDDEPEVSVVTGRCREMFPDASLFNRLCAMEWDGPIGEITACGGIFMTRVGVFDSVGGFNERIIAAEDDDFCIRVGKSGGRVIRIDHEMCAHDADMHHFGQWWRRMERAGYAFAQLGEIHGRYFGPERMRAWGWGLVLPLLVLLGVIFLGWAALILLLAYPASFLRTRRGMIERGHAPEDATLGAGFLTVAKFPNLLGMLKYHWKKFTGSGIRIVEYK